jgi:tetratricopeptide (TPR) repeat protein
MKNKTAGMPVALRTPNLGVAPRTPLLGVAAWEETITLPTYPPPPPDPNPMFLEKRINQGASGRVYPNPFTDHLDSDQKVDRPYQAVFLENEYIQLIVLPEIGGRIHVGFDKTNGYDFFYRQHVVKPALIGLFGSWISGGVEFNWPMHHRPSTFMPVDHILQENADGSRTIWLSDHEPMGRTKGMVGICLRPGSAVIEVKVQLFNRTPYPQRLLWWANVAVHTNEDYQVFFPPDVDHVTFHARADMSYWPVARGVFTGIDYTKGVDISWYKNTPVPASFFVMDSQYDFYGGYDHGRQAGLIHFANRFVAPGKKLFTWGTGDFGKAWERNLTDSDGPYIELMAGAYSDNQPDFSWIQPYETKTFSQFWYPIQKIGPAKNANLEAAVNLEVSGQQAKIGAYATRAQKGAVVVLSAGKKVLFERKVDLAPGAALVETVTLPEGVAETNLLLQVKANDGRQLVRYAPEYFEEKPLPPSFKPLPKPEEIKSNEELYLDGLHLYQYFHPTWAPEPYWQEALRRDPGDARCNNAMGMSYFSRGDFAQAETYFRQAVKTLTRLNPNSYDGEPYYNLGLALKGQGRFNEAYAALYKAIWSYAWQAAGYYALAEIDCRRGDFTKALDHLDRSLVTNAVNNKARALKAAVLRRLDRLEEADALLRQAIAHDHLDLWSLIEQVLLCRAQGDLAKAEKQLQEVVGLMRADVQRYLDIAFDYSNAGLWEEASDLLSRLLGNAECPVYPIVYYALGDFAWNLGDKKLARQHYQKAAVQPIDLCFPLRLEEMQVLYQALEVYPKDARAAYYLGNLLYDKKRYEDAIHYWENAVKHEPGLAIAWRNLGVAYYNIRQDPVKARDCYINAVAANPNDGRLLYELDEVSKRLGTPPARRLAAFEEHLALVQKRDDLSIVRTTLYNQLGEYQKSLDILAAKRFFPWEGGEGTVSSQYVHAHLGLGRAALESGNPQVALQHFQAARVYPENLGEAKGWGNTETPIHYYEGLAYAALGDAANAGICFEKATHPRGEFNEHSYYHALALKKLGKTKEAGVKLKGLREYALRQAQAEVGYGYFYTSPGDLMLFTDDLARLNKIHTAYLLGLAYLGLGQASQAKKAFQEVLGLDINHLGAIEELKRL